MITSIVRILATWGANHHGKRESHHERRKQFHAAREASHHIERKRLLESAERASPPKPPPAPVIDRPQSRALVAATNFHPARREIDS